MVVSKVEFQNALREINESYANMSSRVQALEAYVHELKEAKESAPEKKPRATRATKSEAA